jgi:hypothetical protein
VVVGYVAATRNVFSGRQQARFCDAHSWAEGYFDNIGWVTFDATPGPPPGGGGSDFWDMLEDLDFAWYSHVVNFNGFAQKDLAAHSIRILAYVPPRTWNVIALALLLVLAGSGAVRLLRGRRWTRRTRRRRSGEDEAAARHFYDVMLQALERRGLRKAAEQTPMEFLEQVKGRNVVESGEASLVTAAFCRSFYGEKRLAPEERARAEQAVRTIQQQARDGTDHVTQRK